MSKKTNPPTFMISFNPMSEHQQLYVTHTKDPFFVAEVHGFTDEIRCREFELPLTHYSRTHFDGKFYVLEVKFLISQKVIPVTQEEGYKMAGLFRRSADWFHAYIKFQKEVKK